MTSPKQMRQERSLELTGSLRRGLEWDREYRHSRAQGEAAPQYVEIPEDVNHHREMDTELQVLGYEYAWQRKRWRIWRNSQYVAHLSRGLRDEDWPGKEPSAPNPGKGALAREPPPWATSWTSPED